MCQVLGLVVVCPIIVFATQVLILLNPRYLPLHALSKGLLDVDHVGVVHLFLSLYVLLESGVQLMHLLVRVLWNFGRLHGRSGAWGEPTARHPLDGDKALGQPGLLPLQGLQLVRQFFLRPRHQLADHSRSRRLVLEDLLVIEQ